MEPLSIRERLDCLDVPSSGRGAEHETGADQLAVHQHGAGPALALLTRVLAAGETETLAQDGEQTLVVRRFGLALVAVDRELDSHEMTATRAIARAAITARTWRRYAAVPRTSSIGFAAPAASRPNSFAAASLGRPGRSQPASSRSPAANRSASFARMIVGPQEPRPTPTRRRARSTTSASPATAMTIALRVPTFMKVCAGPASSHSAATISSSRRRTDFFGPVMNSAKGTRRSPFFDLRTTVAPSAASTGSVSPAGEHVPSFPPMVATFRIWGEPIGRAAS